MEIKEEASSSQPDTTTWFSMGITKASPPPKSPSKAHFHHLRLPPSSSSFSSGEGLSSVFSDFTNLAYGVGSAAGATGGSQPAGGAKRVINFNSFDEANSGKFNLEPVTGETPKVNQKPESLARLMEKANNFKRTYPRDGKTTPLKNSKKLI
jgi:hypothetical protein